MITVLLIINVLLSISIILMLINNNRRNQGITDKIDRAMKDFEAKIRHIKKPMIKNM